MGRKAALAIGASAVTASYITWQLTESNRTYCDVPQPSSSKSPQLKPNATPPPPLAPTSVTEVDVFIPDAPPDPVVVAETTISSEPPSEDATEASSEPGAEGESAGANTGAYNPETGEINWDCPCLGGMAHGPCGPEFREAFSCFIYSEEEPKGINCVEKFQNMQNCFRAHPDVYADEIMRDEEDDESSPAQTDSSDAPVSETTEPSSSAKTDATVAVAAADS